MLRIIGAIIVIGVHLCLPMSSGASLDKGRALIAAFFADGVAIFWCISGFFMFDNYDYKHVLQRTLKTVVLPLSAFSAFIFLFGEHGLGIKDVIRSVLVWENPFATHVQLWYLYIYILLMIVSPMVYAFIQYLKEDVQREKWFMVITFAFLIVNDISNNQLAVFSHHTINALVPAMILMIWGNIIYRKIKDTNLTTKHATMAAVVLVLCNVLRWGIQIVRSSTGVDGIHIYFWFTSIALVVVCCLIVIIFAVLQNKRRNKKWARIINSLASYTFMIYMLHMLVYKCVQKVVNLDSAYKALCNVLPMGEGIVSEVLYVVIIVPIVFGIALVLAVVLRKGKNLLWRKK